MKKSVSLLIFFLVFTVFGEALTLFPEKNTFFTGEEIEIRVPLAPGTDMKAFFNNETSKAVVTAVFADQNETLIKIIPLENGQIDIPEMTLIIDGRKTEIEKISVEVLSRTEESDLNLRDIRGTVKIFEKDYFILWLIVVAAAFLLIIFLIRKIMRNRKKEESSRPVVIIPLEVAEKYIKEAVRKREEGDMESFVDLVTIGLRDYMSLKQKINYKEMTTFEVRRCLKSDRVFSSLSNDIVTILKLGDRFKFADEDLSQNDHDILINGFRAIVETVEKNGGGSDTA